MDTYQVSLPLINYCYFTVEADSEAEAIKKAKEEFASGDISPDDSGDQEVFDKGKEYNEPSAVLEESEGSEDDEVEDEDEEKAEIL